MKTLQRETYKGQTIIFEKGRGWELDGSYYDSLSEAKGVADLMAEYEANQEKLLAAHEAEAEKEGAEFYNLGWASGEDFIHSKTDSGRLYTSIDGDGNITHEWER